MAEVTLTKDNFKEVVLDADKPVLVDFWATWCQPCQMLGPIIKEIAEEYEGKAVVGKVDVDSQQELAAEYGIQSIPCVICFKNGQVAERMVGYRPKQDIVKMLG